MRVECVYFDWLPYIVVNKLLKHLPHLVHTIKIHYNTKENISIK